MVDPASQHMAKFAIWSQSRGQASQDMDNFMVLILLKQQQNDLKTNQTKGVYPK
jgi:hypothetical protein